MLIHLGSGYYTHEYSRDASTSRTRHQCNSPPELSASVRLAFAAPLGASQTSTVNGNPSPFFCRPLRPLFEDMTPARESVVGFQKIKQDTTHEDAESIAKSEGSSTPAADGRQWESSSRTSTTFHLAHPAPTFVQKQRLLQIRPKLLLQLQRLSSNARPKPSLDVLPSTVVPRLFKKFPRMFRGRAALGYDDIILVKSEEYEMGVASSVQGSNSDEDGLANRGLVAVICQMPKDLGGSQGKAEMVLSDGSVWEATPLPNGHFEFVSIDKHGVKTTARWARSNRRRSVNMPEAMTNSETKFTFSIIDPKSRRHPILATMNQAKLDIPNFSTTILPTIGKHLATSPLRTFAKEADQRAAKELIPERTMIFIDRSLKTLIQVTGVWLTLRQGWSPYFKYNDAMAVARSVRSSEGQVRSMSLTPGPRRTSPTPTCASYPKSGHTLNAVLGGMGRVSAVGCPRNSSSPQLERNPTIPKRSISTGTAFMQRAAARRAGDTLSTVVSDGEGERRTESKNIHSYGSSNDTPFKETPSASLALPGSSATTPDTPTRMHKCPQSYIPTGYVQNNLENSQPQRHSITFFGEKQTSDQIGKPKISRWKPFTNLFRRIKTRTS